MEFLGIGPLELLFIILLALIILGPKDMQKTGKAIGRELNKLVKSDVFKTARQASDKIRTLPADLMREAGLEEIKQSLDPRQSQPFRADRPGPEAASGDRRADESAPLTPPGTQAAPEESNKIAPPPEDKSA